MRIPSSKITAPRAAIAALGLTLGLLAAAPVLDAEAAPRGPRASALWRRIAAKVRSSVKAEARADFLLAVARANLLDDAGDRAEEIGDARAEQRETKQLANDQYKARLELAVDLEEAVPYSVDIDDITFVEGIDHPLLPYAVGNTWTYEADTEEGLEVIVVTVLEETKDILGVECTVVRDTVSIDGELLEDTHDWFAQDDEGNVWYMGEISVNYEDGQIVDVDGSWESGVDGAHPGIVMLATPAVDDLYRQEFLLGEAEDWGEVLALNETVVLDIGTFTGCLQTLDALTIEPDEEEWKYYAPGIGLVLEVDPEDPEDEPVELVSTNLIP